MRNVSRAGLLAAVVGVLGTASPMSAMALPLGGDGEFKSEAVAIASAADPAPQYTVPSDGGGCSGTFVMPGKPATTDWPAGQDIRLVNCTTRVKFANVVCHPYPTFQPDVVCWSYRIPAGGNVMVSVPSNRQVHDVKWY